MIVTNALALRILEDLRERLSHEVGAAAWLPIGDAISSLDQLDEKSDQGMPWADVLQAYLSEIPGQERLSAGHLNKIKRVRQFVRTTQKLSGGHYTDQEIAQAQFSALEVADRLHTLDPEQGVNALHECTLQQKAFAKMRQEYQAYVEAHPDQLPTKRATWLRKRQESETPRPRKDAELEQVLLSDPGQFFDIENVVLDRFEPGTLMKILDRTDFGFRLVGYEGDIRYIGVELLMHRRLSAVEKLDLVAIYEFQATYFDKYWLFSNVPLSVLEEIASKMEQNFVDSVGIVHFENYTDWRIVTCPTGKSTTQSRRQLLAESVETRRLGIGRIKTRS